MMLAVAALLGSLLAAGPADGAARIQAAAFANDAEALRAMGPAVLPELAKLYARGDAKERAAICLLYTSDAADE